MRRLVSILACFITCVAFAQHDWTALELQTIKRYAPAGFPNPVIAWEHPGGPEISGYWVYTFIGTNDTAFSQSFVTNKEISINELFKQFDFPQATIRIHASAVSTFGLESDLSTDFVVLTNIPPVRPVGVVVEKRITTVTEKTIIFRSDANN